MSFLKNILHAIGSAATAVGKFFANAFKWVETDGSKLAVAIVEEAQTLLKGQVPGLIATILDQLTNSHIPTEVLDALKKNLPAALAVSTGIQNFPANPTDEDITNLENQILQAFGVSPDKSQVYSIFGAKIIAIIRAETMPGQTFTFAKLVEDLEGAYQAYLTAKEEDLQTAA
jgi:hypothetical protein